MNPERSIKDVFKNSSCSRIYYKTYESPCDNLPNSLLTCIMRLCTRIYCISILCREEHIQVVFLD